MSVLIPNYVQLHTRLYLHPWYESSIKGSKTIGCCSVVRSLCKFMESLSAEYTNKLCIGNNIIIYILDCTIIKMHKACITHFCKQQST